MPLRAWITRPAYAVLAAAIVVAVVWPAAIDTAMWWPLLISLVIFGLPHGATDHHVPASLGVPALRAPLIAGYVALTAAGIALWWVAPVAALVLFLALAAAHWGMGDVWFARRVGGRARFGRPWRAVAFIAARGLVAVLLPLLAHPAAAAAGTGAILGAVGADGAGWAPSGAWRAAGIAVVGTALAAALVASVLDHRGNGTRGLRTDAGELVLLTIAMLVVPPVFAVGAYFLTWHAPRHAARLMAGTPAQARLIDDGRVPAAVVAWHREAAPMTALSLLGLVLLVLLAWRTPADQGLVVGAALALIAALTLPHALVVAWMDRVQLLGRPAARGAAAATPPAGAARTASPAGRPTRTRSPRSPAAALQTDSPARADSRAA